MSLNAGSINELLHQNKERLRQFSRKKDELQNQYINIAKRFDDYDKSRLQDFFSTLTKEGAQPREDPGPGLRKPLFPEELRTGGKLSASDWAEATLRGTTVAAVDGSQLAPSSLHGLPFGFVSCGWFVNSHHGQDFRKEQDLRLLIPGDGEGQVSEGRINFQRTYGELEKIKELITELGNEPGKALVFFDGSLIFSFAQHIDEKEQQRYRDLLEEIFALSREKEVVVMGYVDHSLAHDLTYTLRLFDEQFFPGREELKEQEQKRLLIPDSLLFNAFLRNWGDRSPIFASVRKGLFQEQGEAYRNTVLFCYAKTTARALPARLEFPGWVLDAGLADEAITLVLAQCVPGGGYPLALKRAHDLAVISTRDREKILRSLTHFLAQEALPLFSSTKSRLKEE